MQLQDILPRDDYPYRARCHIDLPEVNAAMKAAFYCRSEKTLLKIQNSQREELTGEETWGMATYMAIFDAEGEVAFEMIVKIDKDGIFLHFHCFLRLENNGSFFETTLDFPEIYDVAEKYGIITDFVDDPDDKEGQHFDDLLDDRLASAQWEIF